MNSRTWVRVATAVIVVALLYNFVQTQRDLNQLRRQIEQQQVDN
jgi:cell division protein FtsL